MNNQNLDSELEYYTYVVKRLSNSELKGIIKELNENRNELSRASSSYDELSQKLGIAEEALNCRHFSRKW